MDQKEAKSFENRNGKATQNDKNRKNGSSAQHINTKCSSEEDTFSIQKLGE